MGQVKIRYYTVKRGRGFWQPTVDMRAAGFKPVACGPDGLDAWRMAEECNALWRAHLTTAKAKPIFPALPVGSLSRGIPALSRNFGMGKQGATDPRRVGTVMGSYWARLWRRAPAHRHAGTYQQVSGQGRARRVTPGGAPRHQDLASPLACCSGNGILSARRRSFAWCAQ